MLEILGYLVIGAVVGSIARLVLPNRISGGLIASMTCGVAGALLGGLISEKLFNIEMGHFFNVKTWVIAFLGSLLVLGVWGLLQGRKNKS
jgi:uncharacterized membrane protein YeaQ/YmgE (transglycosylase-associated protein family)